MRAEADFLPAWAIPPGRTVSDLMESKGISLETLALSINLTKGELQELLQGRAFLTDAIADGLAKTIGASADFWLRREGQYREQAARLDMDVDANDAQYADLLRALPLRQMVEFGWIDLPVDKAGKIRKCLEFFGVPSVAAWRRTYGDYKEAAVFRTTEAHPENAPSTIAWLRRGEVVADAMVCNDWNPESFKKQLTKVRALTRLSNPAEFVPLLQKLCAEVGVAVVIAKAPTGCRASGATFFATPNKAVLLLSARYLSDDQFWFSFFHEAGHLVLHYDEKALILEISTGGPTSPKEEEANLFASDFLVPKHLQARMPEAAKSVRGIVRLARDAGISNGIVVGQLQHQGLVRREHFNKLKVRYKWA
ncbi:DNA-binding protein [Pandoraea communis]|uniref:DNA-binding protein n=1 Tax=Pandoraea communis TaxID=2508297 RepID=A0A5E4RCE5_9BURK|nr:ImmA/IrrE family metallo-endopeptidase [Pandoraea communis]VVD60182.1 DNA-binding protein [Pandoraea communis]